MAVRLVVAVTDGDWFNHLSAKADLEEVNFWAPSPGNFRALAPGELFLFKLHAPRTSSSASVNYNDAPEPQVAFDEVHQAKALPAYRPDRV